MIMRLGTFAIGVAIGISTMHFWGQTVGIADEAVHSTPAKRIESNEMGSAKQIVKPPLDDESVDSGSESEEESLSAGSSLVKDPVRIPSAYRELVGPIPRDRLSSSELHAIFENELRDETWAVAMEAGIRDHYARFGARESTVMDYVECRSKYCEIAGFREKGYTGITGQVYVDMTRSGWWQADGGIHHISGHADGIDRFVIIISRYSIE